MTMIKRQVLLCILCSAAGIVLYLVLLRVSLAVPGLPSHHRRSIDLTQLNAVAAARLEGAQEATRWYEHAVLPAMVGAILSFLSSQWSRTSLVAGGLVILVFMAGIYGPSHPAKYFGAALFVICMAGARTVISHHVPVQEDA